MRNRKVGTKANKNLKNQTKAKLLVLLRTMTRALIFAPERVHEVSLKNKQKITKFKVSICEHQ